MAIPNTLFDALDAGLADPVQLTLDGASRLTPALLAALDGRHRLVQDRGAGLLCWADRCDVLIALHDVLPDARLDMPNLEQPQHYLVRVSPGLLEYFPMYARSSAWGFGEERVETCGTTVFAPPVTVTFEEALA